MQREREKCVAEWVERDRRCSCTEERGVEEEVHGCVENAAMWRQMWLCKEV